MLLGLQFTLCVKARRTLPTLRFQASKHPFFYLVTLGPAWSRHPLICDFHHDECNIYCVLCNECPNSYIHMGENKDSKDNELTLAQIFAMPVRRPKKADRPSRAFHTSQAFRIVFRFGGPARLSAILAQIGRPKNASTIYRWMHPTDRKGTGGLIPARAWPDIHAAARADGVVFTPEDLDPRPRTPNAEERRRMFNLRHKGDTEDEFQ